MRILVHFHTANKKTDLIAFVDSGAIENFVSQGFIDEHKLGTRRLLISEKIINADGSRNRGGDITKYTDLEVLTGDVVMTLRFYVADFDKDQLVLGYPWLATNPIIDWTKGTVGATVTLRTSGAAAKAPEKAAIVAGC